MPRAVDKDLRDCLERANPYTEYRIEISQPDVSQVLRRTDQFTQAPSLVSMTPAASLAASARGALILAPTVGALQTFAGILGNYDLNGENAQRRVKGMAWTMDKAFSRCTLKSIQAKVQRVALGGLFFDADIECQVFRITKTPGVKQKNVGTPQYQSIAWTDYTFTPLLSPAPTVKASAQVWDGTQTATLTFDLTNWNLALENSPAKAVAPDQVGELPEYLIVVRLAGKPPAGTGHFRWLLDTASARTIAGVGTFERVWWTRNTDQDQWARQAFADVPNIVLNVESYPANGQAVYLIDQGKAPSALSTGRVDFQRTLPPGTVAKLELSTLGTGGPWTPVKHGDSLAQRRNLVLWSADYDNAAYTKRGTCAVAANTVQAPDGSLTADAITGVALAGNDIFQTVGGLISGSRYEPGFWFQKVTPTGVVQFSNPVTAAAGEWRVDLSLLNTGWNWITRSHPAVTIIVEFTASGGGCGVFWRSLTGTTLAFNLWHCQLEPGTTVGDYIPTTNAVVVFGGAQQTYHLRATLFADTALKATPQVNSLGIEFRIPQDVSIEGIPDLPTREIDMPWPKASIPEGRVRVVRTGIRDYLDVASVIGSTAPTPRLEADIFLASRHPSITREKWLRLERMLVTNRTPTSTSEEFTLLSYASRLKRKIPQKVETINSVHTVQVGSTAAQVIVSPALPGTTVAGNEYDGQGYYMRVRSTAAPNTPPGFPATIQGNTSTDRLDFAPALIEALVAGDVIEVHSGIFQTSPVSFVDADPADVWDAILALVPVPPERIGAGWLARGGKPPRVTDIAPGDAATQAKLKITVRLSEEESADELLDQISTIVGGVTLEVDGQIVFVQCMPLTDVAGSITVPLPPPAAAFDSRDFGSLSTPPGLEKRTTIVSASYGVPATAAAPDAFPSKTTTSVDQDALLWLAQQDLEDYGTAAVDDKITRWLYNSADAGLYLASSICTRMVKIGSTGIRIFTMQMAEKHPDLVPGDVVIIATDQYTDYDPSSQTPIVGPIAVRGVIVRYGREGRDLGIFVPGLMDNVQLVKGGVAGALTGLGAVPAAPNLSATFDAAGQLIINSAGDFATASQKIAWATGAAPSAATVRAAAPIAQQLVTGLATGSSYLAGTTLYIAAFAYNANGVESAPIAVISVTREGSGASAPPVARITPLNTEIDDTVWNLRFEGDAGSGGGGTNLTYTIKQKIGFAAETTLFTGNATAFPKDVALARHPRSDKAIRFRVTDTATGLFNEEIFPVPAYNPHINDTGNPLRGRPYDDGDYTVRGTTSNGDTAHSGVKESGGKTVNRLFAKPLSSSTDDADSIVDSLTKRVIPSSILRFSDGQLLSGVDYAASVAGIPAHSTARQIGRYFNETFEALPANWTINGSPATQSLVAGVASVGKNVLQSSTAEDWRIFPYSLPFNPTKLYRIRSRLRCTVNVASGGSFCYIGVQCRDANDAIINTVYVGMFAVLVNVAAGWVEQTGWFKGATAYSVDYSTDPTAPVSLYPGTVAVRPVYILRDISGVGGTHQIDYIQIDEMDEDLSYRGYTAMENSGNLKAATQQKNGTGLKNIANGRYSIGTGVHAQSITFPTNYQNPPAVNILGGISYEPASVWGTAAQADAGGGGALAPVAARQIDEVVAYNVTASGASLRARLRQASATTARSNAYAAGTITTNGGTLEATTASAPAANDTYTTDFTVQFTSSAIPGKACNVSGTVCLDWWNGSVWTQVASATYSASDPVGGAADTGLISDTLVATVSGLTTTSKFRLRLVTNAGAGARTYSIDPGNVTYTTTAGDQYVTKTPAGLGINLSVEVIGAS
jgi:hypothetical protein